MSPTEPGRRMELLAPAGDAEALDAALEAGADAVYFGLTTLNARRRARNLQPGELAAAVARIHEHHARAYLTLNTDLTERELGQAARMLELARQTGVDAVLVRDPALLLLRPLFPQIEFHLSTQGCAASRADATAARVLGLNRVVLARELTLEEIRAISAVPGIQTEVFVQGALCYCVSGRCLLSSWVGGRSGNRGLCTSPCRVPWRVGDHSPGHLLSMRDLAAVERLDDLSRAGVAALKIEGRMKTAAWVREAVSLYREALGGTPLPQLTPAVERLGAYTGRQMTTGYLDGQRRHLTGAAGRDAAETAAEDVRSVAEPGSGASPPPAYTLSIGLAERGIRCTCAFGGQICAWELPRTAVRREGTATPAEQFLDSLSAREIQGACLDRSGSSADPGLVLAPLTVRTIEANTSAFLHRCGRGQSPTVRTDLPDAVRRCLARDAACPANHRALGDAPDRARVAARQAIEFGLRVPGVEIVVEGATPADLERILGAIPTARLVMATPPAVFEEALDGTRGLVQACHRAGVTIEANTWGVGLLARMAGARWETGPGIPVLNSLAARSLMVWGAAGVTLSLEADRRQLEDVCRGCPAPATLVVYGRPPLMVTRADLPLACLGEVFEDRRGTRMIPRLESGLAVFRPEAAFSIRHLRNPDIHVAHLAADLVAATDPVAEWQALNRPAESPVVFNYGRALA